MYAVLLPSVLLLILTQTSSPLTLATTRHHATSHHTTLYSSPLPTPPDASADVTSSSISLVSSPPVIKPRVDALISLSPLELRRKSSRRSRQSRVTIIKFAIPAIGVWLCNPILSLVDTSVVGVFSGTFDQAALSPAVAITDYSMICLSFMFTATTNLIATVSKKSPDTNTPSPASKLLRTSLQMSCGIGFFLGAFLLILSSPMVKLMIGGGDADPKVFWPAVKYVRIRALGFPAAVALGSAQSACLGLKDTKSPLIILMYAGVLNLICDLVLVPCRFQWFNGAAGAAWATTFSQYAALGLFLRHLTKKVPTAPDPLPNYIEDEQGKSFDTAGFLKDFSPSDLLRRPAMESMKPFMKFFVPVTTTMAGRVSTYVAMNHVVASVMGPIKMAAQQIMLSIFYSITPIADSLGLTAQSYTPELALSAKKSAGGAEDFKTFNKKVLQVSVLFGAVMAVIISAVPGVSFLFTQDKLVRAQLVTMMPYIAAIFLVHGLVCAGEGILLGATDLKFLSSFYSTFFAIMPVAMLSVKRKVRRGIAQGPVDTWKIFLAYNMFRSVLWVWRVWVLGKRAEEVFQGVEEKVFSKGWVEKEAEADGGVVIDTLSAEWLDQSEEVVKMADEVASEILTGGGGAAGGVVQVKESLGEDSGKLKDKVGEFLNLGEVGELVGGGEGEGEGGLDPTLSSALRELDGTVGPSSVP